MNRVLMLGLDGVPFSILDPAWEAGHLPTLKRLFDAGISGTLTSTVPPYTPPGWTSIFTGVNPGKHGIFGFTLGNVQRPGGLVRLDRVASPAIWNAANAQGATMGLFNIPMTYPPPPVNGWAVSGMLTPEGGGATPEGFTHPASLGDELVAAAGSYSIDIDVDYDQDWRSADIIERLSHNLETKRRALSHLLEKRGDVDILFAVLEAPDRLMHVHYKYLDPACEHFASPEGTAIRERAWAFFDEMDRVISELLAWAGNDGYIVVMSDHGFGPKDRTVNVNLALREWGLLSVGGAGAMTRSAGVRKAARLAKKALPKSVWQKAKGAAQSSIDWSQTRAFSAPIPQQGIYVNLAGREPYGTVAASDYEAVRDEIVDRLSSLIDPVDGGPVVDVVHRREEVMQGPLAQDAPDLFPVCRGYSYELSDGLLSPQILDDYRSLPRGFHQMEGVFAVAGPGIPAASERVGAHLYDITPTALYLAGLDLPPMDGEVLPSLPAEMLEERPPGVLKADLKAAGEGAEASPYSESEEALIEESLRNLGYL